MPEATNLIYENLLSHVVRICSRFSYLNENRLELNKDFEQSYNFGEGWKFAYF